ncbi:hypothetical protein IRJ41_014564, partial [Triplophysa rosa]
VQRQLLFYPRCSSHFLGDSDDDSEKEDHPHKKRARGPAKLLTEPTAPVISPPPFIPSGSTAAPPPPTSPPDCAQRPAEEQTPSTSKVYRPTWRRGRCGSDGIACAAAEVHIMSFLELIKQQQEQIIAKISSLATIGGHDTKRVTWNIRSRMFHVDVGRRINWKGMNGKKSFNQMESKKFLLCK